MVTAEIQVVRVLATGRRLRPVVAVAVATSTADRRAVDEAGVEEIIRVFADCLSSSIPTGVYWSIVIIAIAITITSVWFSTAH